ncbi:MAG: hypothetical protein C0494_12620 [Sphingobium sp.]|nr:hypothetical protein [Sphingobium sp.]
MTDIIITQPHPLDAIWSQATEAVEDAQSAIDALPNPYTDEEIDPLVMTHLKAVGVVLALPARNLSDCLYKMDKAGLLDGARLVDFDHDVVVQETFAVLNAAVARGTKLKALNPEFLEGVTL